MQPTQEQQQAIDAFRFGDDLVIEAGAGTGKTTTLKALAKQTERRGQYVAFNRSIVDEAKAKMPANVRSSTMHSLAMGGTERAFAHRLGSRRMRSDQIARVLGIDPVVVMYGTERKRLAPGFLAGHAMRTVKNFCNGADPTITVRHVAYIDGIDPPGSDGAKTYRNNDDVAATIVDAARALWADACKTDGRLPYQHDYYLKWWQLNEPRIEADFILFDEAQDASPVMVSIVEQQAGWSQIVAVGDTQQSIYGWRGAVNALAEMDIDTRTFLTQSFRFGPAVADIANLILERLNAELRLRGTPDIKSVVDTLEQPRTILCRTNAKAVETVLSSQRDGVRAFLIGGGGEMERFAKAAAELQATGRTSHVDLACFSSWQQVIDYCADDPMGDDLRLSVRLIEDYGADVVIEALGRMPKDEGAAQLVVSTAHKSKGREWSTVRLADDFAYPAGKDDLADEEWRLLYVAATRAIDGLDVSNVQPIADLTRKAHDEAVR